jgi:hypothetical protein
VERRQVLAEVIRAALLAVLVTAGCSPAAGPPGISLTATLTSPVDVTLRWDGLPDDAAGAVVEFATEEHGRYTILEFLPPDRRGYHHPDLMPNTPFYYRVRPILGPASNQADAAPPGGVSTVEDALLVPGKEPAASGAPMSQRAAEPTALTAEVIASDAVRLRWTDNAADETGYLVEVRPAGQRDFHVALALDPDVTSVGLITEEPATYRVRAYAFGASSPVVHKVTGDDPVS